MTLKTNQRHQLTTLWRSMMSHPLLKFCNNFAVSSISSLSFPPLTYKREMEAHCSLTEGCFQTPILLTRILSTHLQRPLMLSPLERALPPCTWPPRGHSLENHQGPWQCVLYFPLPFRADSEELASWGTRCSWKERVWTPYFKKECNLWPYLCWP